MPIYMKIDGIDGSVTAVGYEQWIALDSATFGASRPMNTGVGVSRNREAGLPQVDHVQCTKRVDDASGQLTRWALGEPGRDQIQIHLVKTGADGPVPYMKYCLSEPILSSFSVGVDPDPTSKGVESFSISYLRVELEFVEFDSKDKQSGSVVVTYDIAEGRTI